MQRIRKSIPAKILLAILAIEIALLMVMGFFYSSRFNREIDERIADKLALPGILMNQRTLPYDKVRDIAALSDLVQEKVVDAFIFEREGKVFFTADRAKEGRDFADLLTREERDIFGGDIKGDRQHAFVDQRGAHFISSVTPLTAKGVLLGGLYLRISADGIERRKMDVIVFFCFGAALTIVLTTLISAFVIHRMIVPRIVNASSVLKRYGDGDFSARITSPGVADQLGQLMRQVNFLLEEIENNTRKLHSLNLVAEKFSRAGESREILAIAAEKVERHLPLVKIPSDDGGTVVFSLPITKTSDGEDRLEFAARPNGGKLTAADTSFLHALSSLMESALERIESFHRISEAEEKYRELFVSALEGIFRTGKDGKLIEVNPAMVTMMGYDSVAEVLAADVNIPEVYADPEDRRQLLRILERDGKVQEYEVSMRRRDGSIFPVSITARFVKEKNGRLELVEGRIVDISERKLREKEVRERLAAEAVMQAKLLLLEDLEQKNRQLHETVDQLKSTQQQLIQSEKMAAVGMTAGGVAHDLNNILAGVVSYPELLLATMPADSPFRAPLETILSSGRRASAVVADLLTLAKGSARVKQDVSLRSLVEEYLHSVEFQVMNREYPNVQVHFSDATKEVMVSCSPIHIQKVIMNVIMNAVEAAAITGGSVWISVWSQAAADDAGTAAGDFAVLEVRDDGPGIAEENRKHIFEPFYTRKVMGKKGTGLGLTVVWNVVKEHGGRIELDSGPEGTAFRVFLPEAAGSAGKTSCPEDEMDLQGAGKILVVDDEPLQRDIAGKMLKNFGYEVVTAANGEQAIDFLRYDSVDLVVLDMLMPPGINGLQTYREIISIHPDQKALIVSGFSESSHVREAMEHGVGGFVKKPYTMNELAQAVKIELERQPTAA